ncbi:PP2C family serine/threonine-protein phosphatase [Oceanicoccus sp. KOV_DT_Chl]|uniref:PP2C family protein-serine/threonine phosphatase n=1 Tax=Oceanicoccus sp. KOV_DT_Chl TaxID=1904639 RepID=UPI000C7C874A|nr:protein phosphatase 2C domain-containing protein [Oceanicoccus sp. KOV_DT_Chl]
MLSYAAKTDVGNKRSNNEDCYLASPELSLWIMADGVGGQDAGEVASQIVCNVIKSEVQAGQGLEDAIQMSHQAVKASPAEGVGQPGMASTVVALLVHGSDYQVSWVGDSRAYLWSAGELSQLTHDQSLVQRLLDEHVITEEQAANHPRRNLVIQALGQEGLESVEVETVRGRFNENDIILLCSDGLSDYVSDTDIASILQAATDQQAAVDQLVTAALATEGKDNITVLAIHMKELARQETLQMASINKSENESPTVSGGVLWPWLVAAVVLIGAGWLLTSGVL